MELCIDIHGVAFHQFACSKEVAFALDALHFSQQLSEELSEGFVIVDEQECLPVAADERDGTFRVFVNPVGNECTITHVGFLYLIARLNAHELGHQSIEHIRVVLRLISLVIRQQSQFHELLVGDVVKPEQVGTGFFDGVSIGLQGIRTYAWQKLSATMTEAFVEVGMQIVAVVAIGTDHRACGIVDNEFFHEATATRNL